MISKTSKRITILFSIIVLSLMLAAEVSAQTGKPQVKINHTAIYVMNLKATNFFYLNIIGLDTIAEPFHDGKHAWYKTGEGVAMHVIQGSTEKKEYYKNQHTCFSVPSIEAFVERLK